MATLDLALTRIGDFTSHPEQFTIAYGELVPLLSRKEISFCKRLFCCWCCQRSKKETLNAFLSKNVAVINSAKYDDLIDDKEKIQKLFFEALPKYVYNRSAISVGGSLERVLDSDVASKHKEGDTYDPVSCRRINETLSETRFSLRLGVRPEKVVTLNYPAYFLLDRSKERLGIFKPRIEISSEEDDFGACEYRVAHLAEAVNYTIDRMCGLGVVPYTEVFTYKGTFANVFPSTGSYQFYVKDALSFEDARYDDWNFTNFEELAILELITENIDRHFRNILVKKTGFNTGVLVAIDNGNSFPWCHYLDLPAHKAKPLNIYHWRWEQEAQNRFDRMLGKINRIDLRKIEEVLRKDLVDETVPCSSEHIEDKIRTFYQRMKEVRKQANDCMEMSAIAVRVLRLTDTTKKVSESKEEEKDLIYV